MNNIFSFDRFVKVLKYDLKMRVPAITTMFLVFLILPHALHILMGDGDVFSVSLRIELYSVMSVAMIFFAPFTIYSAFKEKHGKGAFLMLPASSFEKFTSMVLVCLLLVPVSFVLCNFLLDNVLVIVLREYYITGIEIGSIPVVKFCLMMFSVLGAALLGNVIFKKKAPFKTILCLLAFTFIWCIFITDFFISHFDLVADVDSAILEARSEQLKNITAIVYVAVGILFYFLTYWRIRKIQIS